jgi:putative endonuclease
VFYVYVLENQNDKSLYIGYSADLKQRIFDHLNGKGSRTTKRKDGWTLIYYEAYKNGLDATGRERFLKSGSGRKYLKKQMANYLSVGRKVLED